MFDFNGDVISQRWVLFMKVFDNANCMADAVEEVWIPKGNMFGTALYLLANILHDDIA